MSKHTYTYLALGDSYTIGEGVALHESFPYQVVQLLRKQGVAMHAPEIVAKTGWTTFELAEHVLHHQLAAYYDFVTLAIGVNNQYRNLLATDYRNDFEFLLKKAIHFAGERPGNVMVLSIPDWGRTPFAQGRDTIKISSEIDAYNSINREVAGFYHVPYIDITPGSRSAAKDAVNVAADKLHPSGKEYARWAAEVVQQMQPLTSEH